MLKKSVMLLIVLFLVIGASGCNTEDDDKDADTDKVFIGGNDGLDVGFIENEPPTDVYDGDQDPFMVSLFLTNKGEFTIPVGGVIASLSGLSQDAFGLSEINTRSKTVIEAKSKIGVDIVSGDNEILQFQELVYKPDLLSDFKTDLKIDFCYQYETNGLANVCLKQNPVRRGEADLCEVNNDNLGGESSAAPLSVVDYRQTAKADKVVLSFKIKNEGNGIVYSPGAFSDTCYDNRVQKDYLNVKVKSGSMDLTITCPKLGDSNQGEIRIVGGGERTILCDIGTSDLQDSAFEEPFDIILSYNYKGTLKKTITVLAE